MSGGRPFTIDRDELKQKAYAYLESEGYKTITDFCCRNRVSRRYFYTMCEQDEELKHISEMICCERERHLEIGGLSGDLNAGMAKFALSQLGWTEKQDIRQDLTADMKHSIDPSKLTDDELRVITEIQRKSGAS